MTYSRKRYWLALAAAMAVAAAMSVIWRPHSAVPMVIMSMVVVAVCGALGFLAYFSLDEIQRQNEMRAWYHGGLLAILFGFAPFVLLMSNALLETMAGFVPDASGMVPAKLHSPKFYFGLGAAVVLGMQVIGHLLAHAIFKISGRAR
jgi:hypothetical protein